MHIFFVVVHAIFNLFWKEKSFRNCFLFSQITSGAPLYHNFLQVLNFLNPQNAAGKAVCHKKALYLCCDNKLVPVFFHINNFIKDNFSVQILGTKICQSQQKTLKRRQAEVLFIVIVNHITICLAVIDGCQAKVFIIFITDHIAICRTIIFACQTKIFSITVIYHITISSSCFCKHCKSNKYYHSKLFHIRFPPRNIHKTIKKNRQLLTLYAQICEQNDSIIAI